MPSYGPLQFSHLQDYKWFGFATLWAEEEGRDREPPHSNTAVQFRLIEESLRVAAAATTLLSQDVQGPHGF